MSVYSTQLRLRNKDVNLHRKLRTSVLFELMQEASIRHTEELGMGREMTLDRGLLWMVTLQRAEIARMPEYDECITLESWPGETMHLLFPRYYRALDEKGETLLSASALWALVDQESRRMVFPDRYGIVIPGAVTGHEIALPSPPRRAEADAVTLSAHKVGGPVGIAALVVRGRRPLRPPCFGGGPPRNRIPISY